LAQVVFQASRQVARVNQSPKPNAAGSAKTMGLLKLSPQQQALARWYDPQPEDVNKEQLVDGKLPGLTNLGNTCFANSVLQCLLNTPGWFAEACLAFAQFGESTTSTKAALGRSFQMLAREYGASADVALPKTNAALRNMKEAIAKVDPRYAGCEQQDAYEFLGCLLEGLEEGFAALFRSALEDHQASPPANVIRAICGITSHTKRSCHACNGCFEVDATTDTCLRLPLLSPAAQFDAALREKEEETPVTLQELLDAMQQPEVIEGYDCDRCRACNSDASRSTITQRAGIISATHDVLIVVLYRFGHALDANGNFKATKVKRRVACPTELSLETGNYNLFGVVSHLGQSLTAGHYVAAVKSRRDDLWYECNDEHVKPLRMPSLYDGRAITAVRPDAEPYILFYHRHQTLPSLEDFCLPLPNLEDFCSQLGVPTPASPKQAAAPATLAAVAAPTGVVPAAVPAAATEEGRDLSAGEEPEQAAQGASGDAAGAQVKKARTVPADQLALGMEVLTPEA